MYIITVGLFHDSSTYLLLGFLPSHKDAETSVSILCYIGEFKKSLQAYLNYRSCDSLLVILMATGERDVVRKD